MVGAEGIIIICMSLVRLAPIPTEQRHGVRGVADRAVIDALAEVYNVVTLCACGPKPLMRRAVRRGGCVRRALVLLLIAVSLGCSHAPAADARPEPLGHGDIHIVAFNDTERASVDVAIRVDDRLLLWCAAAKPNREPSMAFDLPVRLAQGIHRLTVVTREFRKDVTIQVEKQMTVEIRLRDKEIAVEVVKGQRLYL